MKYTLLFILYSLSLFFTGCQDEIEESHPGAIRQVATFTAVQNSTDVATRAMDQSFEAGDEIGIYVIKKSGNSSENLKPSGNYADNKRYIIDQNGNLQPCSEADKIYISTSESYDYYAYYPYNPNLSDPTNYIFHIGVDQTTKADYTANDVMFAKTLNQNNGNISLFFERKMALAEIHFEKVPSKNVSMIILGGIMITANFNLAANEVKAKDTHIGNITMYLYQETKDSYIYRALLPAQIIKGDYLFSVIVDGKIIYYKATSVTPLEAGKKSIYLLNMQYRIEAFIRDAGTGSVTGAEKEIFKHGESVHLKATPDYNYNFVGWYESPMIGWQENLKKVTDQTDYYFTSAKSAWYIAVFELKIQPITATAITLGGYSDGGIVYGSGDGEQGQLHGVQARANQGFIFTGWYINNVLVSTENDYYFTVPDHPVTLEARFQKNLITITIDCYPSKEILAPYYNKPPKVVSSYGDDITLYGYIITDSPYTFDGWYENGKYITRDYSYIFKATQDRHLTARYGLRVFGIGSSASTDLIDQPGYFNKSFTDDYHYPTNMYKGQKLRLTGFAEFQDFIAEYSIPMRITDKRLIIKIGERIVLETTDFEDFIFTAPENATYTFFYSMSVGGELLAGERVRFTFILSRTAWFVE